MNLLVKHYNSKNFSSWNKNISNVFEILMYKSQHVNSIIISSNGNTAESPMGKKEACELWQSFFRSETDIDSTYFIV